MLPLKLSRSRTSSMKLALITSSTLILNGSMGFEVREHSEKPMIEAKAFNVRLSSTMSLNWRLYFLKNEAALLVIGVVGGFFSLPRSSLYHAGAQSLSQRIARREATRSAEQVRRVCLLKSSASILFPSCRHPPMSDLEIFTGRGTPQIPATKPSASSVTRRRGSGSVAAVVVGDG